MRIRFGSHGKIAELELVWRNIHSPHAVPAADTNQIAEWIRRGKATIETDAAPASIKRLTITNANIFYLGHNGSEHQSRMYPFVNLGAIAEVNSRQVSVSVNCPITSD
jgi:hypothetical protein